METELFMHFAEIAGVFVGFGALISVRDSQVKDLHAVVYLQGVLGLGVWVVISALLPIAMSQYGVHHHALWLPCALVALVIWAIFVVAYSRTPDSRALTLFSSRDPIDRFFPVVGLPLHLVAAGSMVLIVVGAWSDHDAALYVTSLSAAVVFAGYALLALVMGGRHESFPTQTSGDAEIG